MTDPKTRKQVSEDLRDLSLHMARVADRLRAFSPENAKQLAGAAEMALEWSNAILEDEP